MFKVGNSVNVVLNKEVRLGIIRKRIWFVFWRYLVEYQVIDFAGNHSKRAIWVGSESIYAPSKLLKATSVNASDKSSEPSYVCLECGHLGEVLADGTRCSVCNGAILPIGIVHTETK